MKTYEFITKKEALAIQAKYLASTNKQEFLKLIGLSRTDYFALISKHGLTPNTTGVDCSDIKNFVISDEDDGIKVIINLKDTYDAKVFANELSNFVRRNIFFKSDELNVHEIVSNAKKRKHDTSEKTTTR